MWKLESLHIEVTANCSFNLHLPRGQRDLGPAVTPLPQTLHVEVSEWCDSGLSVSQYRSLVYLAYGLLAVWTSMGWTYVTLILSHCILLYSISLVKTRWLCLVTGLCTLATFRCEPFISWQVSRRLGFLHNLLPSTVS